MAPLSGVLLLKVSFQKEFNLIMVKGRVRGFFAVAASLNSDWLKFGGAFPFSPIRLRELSMKNS